MEHIQAHFLSGGPGMPSLSQLYIQNKIAPDAIFVH